MNSLGALLKELKQDENVKRFQTLETIIDQDNMLKKEYETLINLQKKLVQKKAKSTETSKEQNAYDNQLQKVMSHYLMEEYLELIEVINNDLQLIQQIISEEINMDFDK